MLRRTLTAVALCVAAVPAFTGTASASCTDNLLATNVTDNDAYDLWQPSDHYGNWAHVDGTATVVVEGDDLLADAPMVVNYEVARTGDVAFNVVDASAAFVDCVAG